MLRKFLNKIPRPKSVLIEQVQTGDNQTALEALRKMQAAGWTQDGTLAGGEGHRAAGTGDAVGGFAAAGEPG